MDQNKIRYYDVQPAPFIVEDSLPTYGQSIRYQKNIGFPPIPREAFAVDKTLSEENKSYGADTPVNNVCTFINDVILSKIKQSAMKLQVKHFMSS